MSRAEKSLLAILGALLECGVSSSEILKAMDSVWDALELPQAQSKMDAFVVRARRLQKIGRMPWNETTPEQRAEVERMAREGLDWPFIAALVDLADKQAAEVDAEGQVFPPSEAERNTPLPSPRKDDSGNGEA